MTTATVYLDFEADHHQDIIEVGAICVWQKSILSKFHYFIYRTYSDFYAYHQTAIHSHCIPPSVLIDEGDDELAVRHQFCDWIESLKFSTILIKGHGLDTTQNAIESWVNLSKFTDMSHLEYEQVNLPDWNQRRFALYHTSAYFMKENINIAALCNKTAHSLSFKKNNRMHYKPPSHHQLAKQQFGSHCALMDCFELAFYEESLPSYCCDKHLLDLFHTDVVKYWCERPLLQSSLDEMDQS